MIETPEQEAILGSAVSTKDNIMIRALAGCGKTTTLRMIERTIPSKPILFLAFNKRIVSEIEYKSHTSPDSDRRMSSTTTVRTFNSLGHRIWAQTQKSKNLSLNAKKVPDILRGIIADEIKKKEQRDAIWEVFWDVVAGVGLAKALGYIPSGKFEDTERLCTAQDFHSALDESPDDLTADLIDLVLFRSIQAAFNGTIDFNDQVYMPALFGGTFPQFPVVMVDEYQDLNPVNHAILNRLVRGRLVGVGDPWQNIYGFRGASPAGMSEAEATFSMTPLDLSVSFRCPQAIVENARWHVPHFKWIKEGGHVETLTDGSSYHIPNDGCVILCRNNAPLFRMALLLLQSGRSVTVVGSDIGPKLIAILRRLGPEELSRSQTLAAIEEYREEKLSRGSLTANDLADCMKVFASHGDSLGQAIRYAEHVLKQEGSIKLMTGHKAKGLEFPHVYHLDRWLCRDTPQDNNLAYVIDTRAMETLTYIDSRAIKWQ